MPKQALAVRGVGARAAHPRQATQPGLDEQLLQGKITLSQFKTEILTLSKPKQEASFVSFMNSVAGQHGATVLLVHAMINLAEDLHCDRAVEYACSHPVIERKFGRHERYRQAHLLQFNAKWAECNEEALRAADLLPDKIGPTFARVLRDISQIEDLPTSIVGDKGMGTWVRELLEIALQERMKIFKGTRIRYKTRKLQRNDFLDAIAVIEMLRSGIQADDGESQLRVARGHRDDFDEDKIPSKDRLAKLVAEAAEKRKAAPHENDPAAEKGE